MAFIPTREECAWAAGFFDGEGHAGSCAHRNKTHRGRVPVVAIPQVDRRVLDRFRRAVNVGRVYGPYRRTTHLRSQPQYRYSAVAHPAVQAICAMLWAWLSPVKREQFRTVLVEEGPSRAHRRVVRPCVHGVLYPSRRCGECRRAYHRRYFMRPAVKVKHLERSRRNRRDPEFRARENKRNRLYMQRRRLRVKERK